VALKVAADPVKAIAKAVRKESAFGVEQKPRGFDGGTRDDDEIGGLLLKTVVGVEVGDAGDFALLGGEDFLDHAAEAQVAQAGGEGARNDSVVRAALGVHFTNETHAPAAAHAGRAAVVGNAVAEHGQVKGMEAEALRGGLEDFVLARGRERRHGERSGARTLEGVVVDIAGNADFVFGFFVERCQIVVADGPIIEGAAFGRAVGGTHAEIFWLVAPGHGAVSERAAADASGVVAVAAFAGENDVTVGVAIHKDAGIALVIRAGIVAQDGSALVAEIILAAIVGGVPAAALQKRDTNTRFGELLGDNAAPCSGSDHDGVHTWQGHGTASALPGKFVVVAAADGNYGNAEHAPTDGIAIAVVAGIAVKALHGVGDYHVKEGLQGIRETIEEGRLLVKGKLGERLAMCGAAGSIACRDTAAVSGLQLAEVAHEMGINVVDRAGPCGAGILIGGNDLFAKGFDGARLAGGEEPPRTGVAAAGDQRGGSSGGGRDLQETAAREGAAFGHGLYLR